MVPRDRPVQILLIEDSAGDAWLIRDILMAGPVAKEIHVVTEGSRALRFLRGLGEYAGAPRPDLVLLDLNLPGRSGLEVLREIKSDPSLRTLTVIVLTTSDATADINAAYDLNANCYVVKPVDLEAFTQSIRGIEEFWLRMAMLPSRPGNQRYPRSSAQNASETGNGPVARDRERRAPIRVSACAADKSRQWRRRSRGRAMRVGGNARRAARNTS